MGTQTPILKFVFDRNKRASANKEGSVELRITYNRKQRYITTGIRCYPKQWKNGTVTNRLDALELQQSLDQIMTNARRIINEVMSNGEFDMQTVISKIVGSQKKDIPEKNNTQLLMPFFIEKTAIRKYGRSADSQERYDRFLRWFADWNGMQTFSDLTEANILRMDKVLREKRMKPYSIWNNYHRFLNSYILDAIEEGIIKTNPYKKLHIDKDKKSDGLSKYLTKEEFMRIAALNPPTEYLARTRDLFVFQTYTCLAYTDLAHFNPEKIRDVNGHKMYIGKRGKTKQEFMFMLLPAALKILDKYHGKLPIISNVKYNAYIKVLAMMAGIHKPVSSHWARHTGATLLLNSGASMEIVSRVLGHSSTKITREVYAKLLDVTVANAMQALSDQLDV